MDKKQRLQYLQKLSRSNEGVALREYFTELINKLTDGRNYSKENFEKEGLGKVEAAKVLEKVLKDLNMMEKPTEKTIDKYN